LEEKKKREMDILMDQTKEEKERNLKIEEERKRLAELQKRSDASKFPL
jgi:hypothetical protein